MMFLCALERKQVASVSTKIGKIHLLVSKITITINQGRERERESWTHYLWMLFILDCQQAMSFWQAFSPWGWAFLHFEQPEREKNPQDTKSSCHHSAATRLTDYHHANTELQWLDHILVRQPGIAQAKNARSALLLEPSIHRPREFQTTMQTLQLINWSRKRSSHSSFTKP